MRWLRVHHILPDATPVHDSSGQILDQVANQHCRSHNLAKLLFRTSIVKFVSVLPGIYQLPIDHFRIHLATQILDLEPKRWLPRKPQTNWATLNVSLLSPCEFYFLAAHLYAVLASYNSRHDTEHWTLRLPSLDARIDFQSVPQTLLQLTCGVSRPLWMCGTSCWRPSHGDSQRWIDVDWIGNVSDVSHITIYTIITCKTWNLSGKTYFWIPKSPNISGEVPSHRFHLMAESIIIHLKRSIKGCEFWCPLKGPTGHGHFSSFTSFFGHTSQSIKVRFTIRHQTQRFFVLRKELRDRDLVCGREVDFLSFRLGLGRHSACSQIPEIPELSSGTFWPWIGPQELLVLGIPRFCVIQKGGPIGGHSTVHWFIGSYTGQYKSSHGTYDHTTQYTIIYIHMGLSENSVPHCTQWFCWSLSLLNGYFIGGIPHFQTYPYTIIYHVLWPWHIISPIKIIHQRQGIRNWEPAIANAGRHRMRSKETFQDYLRWDLFVGGWRSDLRWDLLQSTFELSVFRYLMLVENCLL